MRKRVSEFAKRLPADKWTRAVQIYGIFLNCARQRNSFPSRTRTNLIGDRECRLPHGAALAFLRSS
jgi:hypothetical protein